MYSQGSLWCLDLFRGTVVPLVPLGDCRNSILKWPTTVTFPILYTLVHIIVLTSYSTVNRLWRRYSVFIFGTSPQKFRKCNGCTVSTLFPPLSHLQVVQQLFHGQYRSARLYYTHRAGVPSVLLPVQEFSLLH